VLPVVLMVAFFGWPFIEAWVTAEPGEHHLLQRPRNAPTRTGFLVASVTFYGVLCAAGGNDILATVCT
jgi:ubiquinol-cytochrome c reductase cytochrome b subunit